MSEEEKNQFLKTWQSDLHVLVPLPDRIISEYLLLSVFKESESSCTCFVSAKEDGRFFILKCSRIDSRNTALREYKMLKHLESLNAPQSIYVPSFMDYFEEDGTACLIRDYLYGQSLRELVENSPDDQLTEDQLKSCALQLCEALDFLHSQDPPIIHRDIKPDNVIIDQYGRFRLIDFGIARLYRKNGNSDTTSMGSEHFAAPEQFGYSQTDARTDIYSLGALLLYGATCENEISKLDYSGISDDFKKIIRKCMQFAPEDRYQNSSELRRDLEKPGKISLHRKQKSWFFRGILCGAGLTAALTFSVYFLFSSGLFPNSLSAKKDTENPDKFWADEAFTENTGDISAAKSDNIFPADSGSKSLSENVPGDSELLSSQIAGTPVRKTSTGGKDAHPADLENETFPANEEHPTDQDEIYTFREPLIERAARACLNKKDDEPVTMRDLRGIVFIGLYENQILFSFDDVFYSNGLPYISPKTVSDPDNILPNEISSLEDLTAMPNLKELSLCNIRLDSLEGLNQLHLTELALVGANLTDYEAVSTQSDLENLVIIPKDSYCNLDLLFLPKLRKLTSLNLCNVKFSTGCDFLTEMPSLEELTVSKLSEDLISVLKKINIKTLTFWSSYSPGDPLPLTMLSGCTSIETLGILLTDNDIIYLDQESPSDLPNLQHLTFSGYYLRDFECLSKLEKLEDLSLVGYNDASYILDCRNLDKLPSLTQIHCSEEIKKVLEKYYPKRTFQLISD